MKRYGWRKYAGIVIMAAILLCGCHASPKDSKIKELLESAVSEMAEEQKEEQEESGREEESESQEESQESSEEERFSSEAESSANAEEENGELQDYVIPGSDSRYLTGEDVKNLSKEEFRIARNEIYARHGRRFQSQDLQEYFNGKGWYEGSIEPSDFRDELLNEYEKANLQFLTESEASAGLSELANAPSKEIIDHYGYENGYSVLAFTIKPGTVKDHGAYYEVDAVYHQGIEAPGNLSYGQQVTLVFNELTGEKRTLVYREGGLYNVDGSYDWYYYSPSADGSPVVLYQDSDDRVDKPVYDGKLYIRKDATEEIAIMNDVRALTRESLEQGSWFNGVYFDQKGYAVRLVFYGD